MPSRTLLTGAKLCLPSEVVSDAALLIEGGRIAAIGAASADFDGDRRDFAGHTVYAGFIDTHVHGGLEHDVMDATPEALAAIGQHLARHGVTGWLATTVACPAAQLDAILTAVARAMASPHGAPILGAHLESNFLAAKYKGAQPAEHLRAPDDAELLAVIERHKATIRVVTLAPELPGAMQLIAQLVAWGIQPSIGHTDATYDQVKAAHGAGATRVTHLCNAQRGLHHREPGVVGAALTLDLYAEVIADLQHLHPAVVEIAYRCKGASKLVLVSDALRGTGLPPGEYELGGQRTTLDGRVAKLADGTIAGSVVTLGRAVANCAEACNVPWAAAAAMAAATPARSLGLTDRGELVVGQRADLAVLDAGGACVATMIEGLWVSR
ncbi:MAG: nagA [Cyanobacteria bacterium RYN_339]|nr:nagA [Cyanobacteria bacterium RYN_339]